MHPNIRFKAGDANMKTYCSVASGALMVIVLMLSVAGVPLFAQVIHPLHVIDNGGGTSNGGGITLQSSIGQPVVGAMIFGGISNESGYIPSVRIIPTTTLDQHFTSRWNMISVPLYMSDNRTSVLYPSATTSAYAFQGSYVQVDTLLLGSGYWLKFGSANTVHLQGISVTEDSVVVRNGWNLIGSISSPLPAAYIRAVSPTVINSDVYGYSSGYKRADTLFPGIGYWIKVANAGKIVLQWGSVLIPRTPAIVQSGTAGSSRGEAIGSDFSSLVFTDAEGKSQTLYFTPDSTNVIPGKFELPPSPPPGDFDVRYATQRALEVADNEKSKDVPILASSVAYPLSVQWHVYNERTHAALLIDGEPVELKGSGSIRVSGLARRGSQGVLSRFQLRLSALSGDALPKQFALQHNYPNPFNPTTTLKYQLPVDSKVTVRIYNVLGQTVATIADGNEPAGYKSVQWNAVGVASGVYFCKLEAVSLSDPGKMYSRIEKMMLLK